MPGEDPDSFSMLDNGIIGPAGYEGCLVLVDDFNRYGIGGMFWVLGSCLEKRGRLCLYDVDFEKTTKFQQIFHFTGSGMGKQYDALLGVIKKSKSVPDDFKAQACRIPRMYVAANDPFIGPARDLLEIWREFKLLDEVLR